MTTHAYHIPACNLPEFQRRLDGLNKRARRLGVAEISFSTTHAFNEHEFRYAAGDGVVWRPDHKTHRDAEGRLVVGEKKEIINTSDFQIATGRVREWLRLEVTGEAPKFAGWSLVGCLEPLTLDDGGCENIVRAVPGESVPAEYRGRVGECDHCNARRRRNETFVVRHDDGSHKMVGRQCLKDFLGHANPHSLAAAAQLLCELAQLCGEASDEGWGGGGYGEATWTIRHFLTITAAVVRLRGWVSRTKARDEERMATADIVLDRLIPPRPASREWQQWADEVDAEAAKPEHAATAERAVEWGLGLEPAAYETEDYLYNVNLICRAGTVGRKTAGLAASIAAALARAEKTAQDAADAAARPAGQHVGQVGKRQEFTVRCNRVTSIETPYGAKGIHGLTDEAGNDLVWFATSGTWLEVGETYRVKATVKEHGEFRGRPQTVLMRVSVVGELTLA